MHMVNFLNQKIRGFGFVAAVTAREERQRVETILIIREEYIK